MNCFSHPELIRFVHKVAIGPQWRLVVLDGYEHLVVEPRDTTELPTPYNSEATGHGFLMHFNIRDPAGKKVCVQSL